ncbi:MAG: Gar/GrdA family gentamicin resistance ATP-binding protein [Chloroflexi bacterium]|nr:Gar/GrdA family gentamicin resistance ATP-binding protein [Chloroflexota bacterium]
MDYENKVMIILLNGPLGIGKSTLAEALMEEMDGCVMLDGDHVVALNPPPPDELEYLHTTLTLLIQHHQARGYRHFVINHIWRTPDELEDLHGRIKKLDPTIGIHCFLLTLPLEENLRRIHIRQGARAIDEQDFEQATVMEERAILLGDGNQSLGEPFDVSGSPEALVTTLLTRLGI